MIQRDNEAHTVLGLATEKAALEQSGQHTKILACTSTGNSCIASCNQRPERPFPYMGKFRAWLSSSAIAGILVAKDNS